MDKIMERGKNITVVLNFGLKEEKNLILKFVINRKN